MALGGGEPGRLARGKWKEGNDILASVFFFLPHPLMLTSCLNSLERDMIGNLRVQTLAAAIGFVIGLFMSSLDVPSGETRS